MQEEEKLLTEAELLVRLNIPIKKFGELRRKGIIPVVRLGHRSYRYRLSSVMRALSKLETRALT